MGITQTFGPPSDGADDTDLGTGMGITYPGGPSDGAEHNDLSTAMDGDATRDSSGGAPPALADYDPLREEQSDPPVFLDDAGDGADAGQGGDEYPEEDPSPS